MSNSKTVALNDILAQLEGSNFSGSVCDGKIVLSPIQAPNETSLEMEVRGIFLHGGREAVVNALANLNRKWAVELQEAAARGVNDE